MSLPNSVTTFLLCLVLASVSSISAFHVTSHLQPSLNPFKTAITFNAIAIPNESFFLPDHDSDDASAGIRKKMQRKLRIKNKGVPSYIHRISTAQEFHKIVEAEEEKIVVVRFHAHWCKTCKAMAPLFYRMAEKMHEDVVFVELEHSQENAPLFEQLGIPGVPFGHIYHPKLGLMHQKHLLKRTDSAEFEKQLKRIFFCT